MITVVNPSPINREYLTCRTQVCSMCEKDSLIDLPAFRVRQYFQGAFVQDAFPNLSPSEREMIISGIHASCWDALFASEDD